MPAVKKALDNLPPTLDDTYSRILDKIPVDYSREAQVVFQLLSVAYHRLMLDEIAEAVVIDVEKNEFHVRSRLRRNDDILEICGGLVTLIEQNDHYVKRPVAAEILSARDRIASDYLYATPVWEQLRVPSPQLRDLSALKLVEARRPPFPAQRNPESHSEQTTAGGTILFNRSRRR